MEAITTAITTALGTLKGDVLTVMGVVVTGGLAIFGVKFAAVQGMSFFKKISK